MGTALLQIKVMPESPETDLEQLKTNVEEKLKKEGAIKISKIEIQPVAFGLKSLIVTLAWPEEQDTEKAVKAVNSLEHVSSSDIIDYRRAFG